MSENVRGPISLTKSSRLPANQVKGFFSSMNYPISRKLIAIGCFWYFYGRLVEAIAILIKMVLSILRNSIHYQPPPPNPDIREFFCLISVKEKINSIIVIITTIVIIDNILCAYTYTIHNFVPNRRETWIHFIFWEKINLDILPWNYHKQNNLKNTPSHSLTFV